MGVFHNFFEFGWEANRKQWNGSPLEHLAEYSLSVIEFDDQGWYHDLAQRDALMRFLDEMVGEDLLILVFVHGWKHNAAADDAISAPSAPYCATRGRARTSVEQGGACSVYISAGAVAASPATRSG